MDARALASPNLSVILAGNKADLTSEAQSDFEDSRPPPTPSSTSSKQSSIPWDVNGSIRSTSLMGTGTRLTATRASEGREVSSEETSHWAAKSNIPVAVEISALTGDGVEEVFNRLARIILTKIELGEIDPDDPQSGIQYGDGGLYMVVATLRVSEVGRPWTIIQCPFNAGILVEKAKLMAHLGKAE